jgi:hypothetical protein
MTVLYPEIKIEINPCDVPVVISAQKASEKQLLIMVV